ncbi:MAG: hypothetical protein R3224_08820 [Balneolaceae bacterium]|nr:hypothetical protein [Balneolaceae bacterium]
MKYLSLLLSISISLLAWPNPPAHAQLIMGSRPVAMGQASAALPGLEWALFANPATMHTDKRSISFFGIRYYGFPELTDLAAAANIPTRWGVVGAGAHRYGFDLFSESRIRLGYKNRFRNFHYGLTLNYTHISQGGGYGSAGAWGVDAGMAAAIFDRFWIGARAVNLNQPAYGKGDSAEPLPRELAVGFSYRMSELTLMAVDVVKDVRFPASFRGGVEITVVNDFYARAGVTTEPNTFSIGFGYSTSLWTVNVAAQHHAELGISPGLDLGIHW